MKFSSILKKINFKSRKSMLKTGAILFWTDMKRLFNWNMDNFKSNFLSRGQLGSKSNDKFFLSVLKMWQCCKYFFGNLIFALTARTLSGNRRKWMLSGSSLCILLFLILFKVVLSFSSSTKFCKNNFSLSWVERFIVVLCVTRSKLVSTINLRPKTNSLRSAY